MKLHSYLRRAGSTTLRLGVLASILLLGGCFEILQTIDAKKDGTIRVSVRVTMSKALQSGNDAESKMPDPKDFIHDTKRIHNNVKARDLSDDMMLRRQYDFSTTRKLLGDVSESDQGMLLPYPDGSKQWVFIFRSSGGKKGASSEEDAQSEQFAKLFLSSANYRLFFRGTGLPRTVVFTAMDGTRHSLRPTPFGDGMLVDCPLLLMMQGGVLTTSEEAKIDFQRTDRLLDYLKQSLPEAKDETSDSTDESASPDPSTQDQSAQDESSEDQTSDDSAKPDAENDAPVRSVDKQDSKKQPSERKKGDPSSKNSIGGRADAP